MKKLNLSLLALFLIFASCKKEDNQEDEKEVTDNQEQVETKISIAKLEDSPKFEDASLSLDMVNVSEGNDLPARVDFNFKVENYELGAQTPTAIENDLANSGKGQHIHFILDNSPYSAHYEPSFSKEIGEGHHVLLAFLSRSYHESVKNAYLVKPIKIGNPEGEPADLTAQHLFYSRPKGTYSGKDTENLLLDFFLVNAEISETGNKVKATINGEDFMITEWAPYVIKGLDKGEVEIRLQLLDAEDNLIPGPFNDVTRMVTLD
jgi:hypothetical protein